MEGSGTGPGNTSRGDADVTAGRTTGRASLPPAGEEADPPSSARHHATAAGGGCREQPTHRPPRPGTRDDGDAHPRHASRSQPGRDRWTLSTVDDARGPTSGHLTTTTIDGAAPTATAAAEADRKTSNDVRRGSAHGHAVVPAGAQGKATDGTLKQQPATARNGMVAAAGAVDGARGVAAHNYYYYEREQPAYREDAAAAAADFYHHHHHPAATAATADHERY
ncbi:hypothetical protein SORBI_3003G078501 [Sorghum bicolor]|uniref:Uncharacterized protein n=1 Tax=Sorghum bicolor TaxID=4558 RepID=A0A1W0VW43_SORBI|nr:hypothetical protein SORBI_3003G078501 [Sorghum bicolor]